MCYTILEIFDLGGAAPPASACGIIRAHDDLGGVWFDHGEVIRRLIEAFESVQINADDDPLAEEARRAEEHFAGLGVRSNPVIRSLRNKAKVYGPAFTFTFTAEHGETVKGLVRRYDIRFVYGEGSTAETRREIADFLRGFSVGQVEERSCGK